MRRTFSPDGVGRHAVLATVSAPLCHRGIVGGLMVSTLGSWCDPGVVGATSKVHDTSSGTLKRKAGWSKKGRDILQTG